MHHALLHLHVVESPKGLHPRPGPAQAGPGRSRHGELRTASARRQLPRQDAGCSPARAWSCHISTAGNMSMYAQPGSLLPLAARLRTCPRDRGRQLELPVRLIRGRGRQGFPHICFPHIPHNLAEREHPTCLACCRGRSELHASQTVPLPGPPAPCYPGDGGRQSPPAGEMSNGPST